MYSLGGFMCKKRRFLCYDKTYVDSGYGDAIFDFDDFPLDGSGGSSHFKDSSDNSSTASVDFSDMGYSALYQLLAQITSGNSALSQEYAQQQMDFQEDQNAAAMKFNHDEAALNRSWQEMMSNTAYQRSVADMIAAGINPALAAGGSGASTTSGATASGVSSQGAKGQVDTSLSNFITSMMGSIINAETSKEIAGIQAQSAASVATINAETSKYKADLDAATSLSTNQRTNDTNYSIQKSKEAFEQFMTENYPNNLMQLFNSIFNNTGMSYSGIGNALNKIFKGLFDTSLIPESSSGGGHSFSGSSGGGHSFSGSGSSRFVSSGTHY